MGSEMCIRDSTRSAQHVSCPSVVPRITHHCLLQFGGPSITKERFGHSIIAICNLFPILPKLVALSEFKTTGAELFEFEWMVKVVSKGQYHLLASTDPQRKKWHCIASAPRSDAVRPPVLPSAAPGQGAPLSQQDPFRPKHSPCCPCPRVRELFTTRQDSTRTGLIPFAAGPGHHFWGLECHQPHG